MTTKHAHEDQEILEANPNHTPVVYRSITDRLTKKMSDEEITERLTNAMTATALSAKGKKASEFYGQILECRNVVTDPNTRPIMTEKGAIEVTKTSWNVALRDTNDWFWIDTYTAACEDYAEKLQLSLGEGPWPVYWPLVFFGQVTKRHQEDGKETDCVASV